MFDAIRIRERRIVRVSPKRTTAPLLALTSSMMRSRPGSELQYRTLGGIVIEEIEDLAAIADDMA